jgi:RNA polymerase sigma-70 factor (ECF subfamily)
MAAYAAYVIVRNRSAKEGAVETQETEWAEAMRAERGGDDVAYARFLEAFAGFLRRILRYRLGHLGLNPSEAEDVVQEVLIAVHLRRAQWDASRPLLPWLNAIARYKLIDAIRRLRRESRLRVQLDEQTWSSLLDDGIHEQRLETDEVERVVSGLPTVQRSVVRAIGIEGASPQEAAQGLGMNEGAVRVAFHRGLKRIMQLSRTRWQ